ncbi:MAG TPA: DMT family transporter [Roseiarcus sp.]|jgi:drug/metabolite transporter (DMT)-like permease|nr:DMT family transporter [Roseiarcus sp.]
MTAAALPSRASGAATMIGLCAILLWSALALLTAASGEVPPFELAALTFAVGGGCGLFYAALRGRLAALIQPWPVWLVGIGGLFGYHALYFAALRRAPPAEASLIAYLWPLLIVLLAALQPGERLSARHVIGAALGLAGVAALFAGKSGGALFSAASLGGDALALCCAFVWSVYSVASRRLKEAPTEAVAGFCVVTALLAAACHFAFEPTVTPASAGQWLAILGLGLGPVGLAFYVWDYGVKHGDIKMLGVAAYAAPVLSTLILVAAGFAPATASLAIACALIVAGAAVASIRRG